MRILAMLFVLGIPDQLNYVTQLWRLEHAAYLSVMECISKNETKAQINQCAQGVNDDMSNKMTAITQEAKRRNTTFNLDN